MLGFIVLSIISTTAFAAPQYNYQLGAEAPLSASQILPVIYNKQYYIHSAPDDALDSNDQPLLANKRNLRIVFIKTPENKGPENAALQLAKAAGDDRTAIYILNKQTDLGDLQNKLSQITDQNAKKPEVHFIKYRTPGEAEHAQHAIRAQYDSLGGPSIISHEGIVPIRSFVGSLGQRASAPATAPSPSYETDAVQSSRAQNDYLPPS